MAHQPPTQQAELVLKQLSCSNLTGIMRKCFSTTLNCISTLQVETASLQTCACLRERVGCDWKVDFVQRVTFCGIKWIHHSRPTTGTSLTARLHHAAGHGATDTCQLEKNHLHWTRSKKRMRVLQPRLFHWWKPLLGFKRPEISERAEILIWLMK